MSTTRLMQIISALMIFSGLGAAPATQPSNDTPQNRVATLETELEKMTKQCAELTKTNAALLNQVARLQVQLATQTTTRQDAMPNTIPDGWTARQFNGMTVYTIPLEEGRRVAPTTRPTRIK